MSRTAITQRVIVTRASRFRPRQPRAPSTTATRRSAVRRLPVPDRPRISVRYRRRRRQCLEKSLDVETDRRADAFAFLTDLSISLFYRLAIFVDRY